MISYNTSSVEELFKEAEKHSESISNITNSINDMVNSKITLTEQKKVEALEFVIKEVQLHHIYKKMSLLKALDQPYTNSIKIAETHLSNGNYEDADNLLLTILYSRVAQKNVDGCSQN